MMEPVVATEEVTKINNLPEDDDIPKGKLKKVFRKLQSALVDEIQARLDRVNSQVKGIEATLDKKYGGMYKVLIHTFLNKQENKIYNLEIQNMALKEMMAEFVYAQEKSTDDFDTFKKAFTERFTEKLVECKKFVDEKYLEKQGEKDGSPGQVQEGSTEGTEEIPDGIK